MKNNTNLLGLIKGVLILHCVFFSNFATAQPGNGNGMPGGPGANFWNLQGNNVNSGQFLGSTNNASLIFKTNNLERISLLGNGEILFHNFIGNNNGLVGYNPNGTLYNIPFTGNGTMVLADNGSFISNAAISGWSMNGNFLYNATHQVGIGVTAPSTSHLLTVNGDALFTGEITTTGIKVLQKIEADTIKGAIRVDVNGNLMLGEEGGYDGITSRYEDLKINSRPGYDFNVIFSANNTGNVGIGTTSPSKKFEVNGTSGFSGPVSVGSSLFVQDSASFSQKVKMNGEVMMPNLDTLPNLEDGYFLFTNGNGEVFKKDFGAILGEMIEVPAELTICTNQAVYQNPKWGWGTNKLYTCPPIKVGIGLQNPIGKLHLYDGDLWVDQGKLFIRNDASSTINPIEVKAGQNNIFELDNKGKIEVWHNGNSPFMRFHQAGASTSPFTIHSDGGIEVNHLGSSPMFVFKQDGNSQTLLQLNADGMLRARKIKVDQQVWPDYVFKKDYKLLTPYEIEAFVEENGHLPGVPSEEEILEEGLDVGEMNAVLLEKIEEMTLLLIEQQKQIDALKEQQKKETVTK